MLLTRLFTSLALVSMICVAATRGQETRVSATLSLAAPISDHMVLQQAKPTSVWGTASPESMITIKFAEQTITAEADTKGHWIAELKPLDVCSDPATMTISSDSGESLQVEDILVGEVWMCSGQSNMFFPLNRITNLPQYEAVLAESDLPKVRFFNTASKTAMMPQRDCEGQWNVMTPQTAGEFSAVGYFFGRNLHEELGVPIGLIGTAWGGKPAEAFTSYDKLQTLADARELLDEWGGIADRYDAETAKAKYETALAAWTKKVAKLRVDAKAAGERPKLPRKPALQGPPKLDPNYPGAIYNQKIAPWTEYAIAGAIWYQGESNRNRAAQYRSLLTALIKDWREQWGDPIPFYVVQLANFQQPSSEPGTPDAWAELQNAQTLVAQTLPNCAIAVINDIGEAGDIHPKNKRDVGLRLARLALAKTYEKKIDPYSSPLYQSHVISGNRVAVSFEHVGKGLQARDGGELRRFEIAGEDRVWHWADASIDSTGKRVVVTSDQVAKPVAVRYAWAANPEGANLVNSAGLPASLFRTDDWPLSTDGVFTRLPDNDKRQSQATSKRMIELGYTPLFNGTDLSGWRNPYDYGTAKVVHGEIHLTANKKFFLVTEKKYSDFRLMVEIKLPEGEANSGVMFRCHVEPNKVYGYQAECDGSDRRWSAGLYDEGRRQWVWPSTKGRSLDEFLKYEAESQAHFAKPEIRDALKRSDWNRYIIHCRGDRISIDLNGVKITNLRDSTDAEGYIGIQHHGEPGQTYRFRNLFIKELTNE